MGLLRAACLVALLASGSAHAASNPWFGTWQLRLTNPGEAPETLVYSDAGGGAMRMESVEAGSVIVTRFDGRPASDRGRAAAGGMLAVKATSPTSYDWTFFKDGRPYVRGRNRIAVDRRTFIETSWLVTRPKDMVTLVYERRGTAPALSPRSARSRR